MLKVLGGFVAGLLVLGLTLWNAASHLMFTERESPFGLEETVARIQANIVAQKDKGWSLSGLRNPARAVNQAGGNVLPVMMVEACSPLYSKPILKDDTTRFLSILMPCKVTVYKKNDGKVYIGMMNAALVGKLFGATVGGVMAQVAQDQAKFVEFDPSKPAPPLIQGTEGGGSGSGGSGPGGGGGC